METQIDNIWTHDFRFSQLGKERNVLLNKRENNKIDIVILGEHIQKGERVLLTMTLVDEERDTAWIVESVGVTMDESRKMQSHHCILTFEGTITP